MINSQQLNGNNNAAILCETYNNILILSVTVALINLWLYNFNSFMIFRDPTYLKIIQRFEERKQAPYSIHQVALMGASEGKEVGQWFGPNTVAQVLKLVAYATLRCKKKCYVCVFY